ncbi:UDP-N-acetylglucosamine--N-acetylmuramyl-(pentapeptide) pyrophosphoryl-undecaprenol N-acetylglucosamine transferase [Candidatus Nomurabacteria bacterium]|nr:UDP-N-acetylglucosamine--N-acetylmuramyl-(pentapeptide) pyrophosphoryl-undecaprenol N-acetylglucosamine transferase [Candidatus Nomurabacteria bacterium]
MKILFTGGGSGGHFYPIIATAEAINDAVRERKLIEPKLYYAAPEPYDKEMLIANNITFVPTSAGKMRNYFSILNFFDSFKTAWGIFRSILRVFFLYPDVVFGTGGYASFPTLLAAKLFRIPVVIYATDAEPSRVNRWAGKFAEKIAVSYASASEFFPKEKVAHTGNPVRKALLLPAREGSFEFLGFKREIPVLLVVGGSQGAQTVNEAILAALPQLLEKYQVVHQTGEANLKDVEGRARVALGNTLLMERYKAYGYLNDLATRMAAGAASMVIARAGSGTIFEIASWGLPSILVPIPEPISHDQKKNAFDYARTGACVVIEQNNLTPGLLVSEVDRIMGDEHLKMKMGNAARSFSRPDSAKLIADAILDIALSHEV